MTTFRDTKCTDRNWSVRELTANEIEIVKEMVSGYENVTVTGVHFDTDAVEVWLAVNYQSRKPYPNNHREYQLYKSTKPVEWRGWN